MTDPLFNSDQDSQAFAAALTTRAVGRRIHFVERTGSTNDLAMKAARAGARHGEVFVADVQDGGRGRRGRTWESPPRKSLLLSVLIRLAPDLDSGFSGILPADYGWVPLVAGLASAEAIADAAGLETTMKWPNDVVVPASGAPGWRKLGGILCESVLAQPGESSGGFIVIGIGLNINQSAGELPEFAKAPPSSIYLETSKTAGRQAVLRALLHALETRVWQLSQAPGNAAVKDAIAQRLGRWWMRKTLCVEIPAAANSGAAVVNGSFGGLDEFGRLKIIQSSGRESVLADAEILSIV